MKHDVYLREAIPYCAINCLPKDECVYLYDGEYKCSYRGSDPKAGCFRQRKKYHVCNEFGVDVEYEILQDEDACDYIQTKTKIISMQCSRVIYEQGEGVTIGKTYHDARYIERLVIDGEVFIG